MVFFPVVNLLKISALSFEGSICLCNLEVFNKAVTFLVLVYNANRHKDSNLIPFFYWNIALVLTLDLIYRGCIFSVIASQCQLLKVSCVTVSCCYQSHALCLTSSL